MTWGTAKTGSCSWLAQPIGDPLQHSSAPDSRDGGRAASRRELVSVRAKNRPADCLTTSAQPRRRLLVPCVSRLQGACRPETAHRCSLTSLALALSCLGGPWPTPMVRVITGDFQGETQLPLTSPAFIPRQLVCSWPWGAWGRGSEEQRRQQRGAASACNQPSGLGGMRRRCGPSYGNVITGVSWHGWVESHGRRLLCVFWVIGTSTRNMENRNWGARHWGPRCRDRA